MGFSRVAQKAFLYLCVSLAVIYPVSSELYVVYMGGIGSESPEEILRQNLQLLTSLHGGSEEQAKASLVYSYMHGFKGFAANLTEEQAYVAEVMPGVISVLYNSRRILHTTHSWDFMGLVGEETMEIPGYSTKNQTNVIIGLIDTGIWPESPSFNDVGMPSIPAGWKGQCQPGEAFNSSTCNRKVIGARYYLNGYEAEEEPEKVVSYRSARDSVGHGSHTASTAAGRYVNNMNYSGLAAGGARGGAPMARIAIYKACWNSVCYDADLLAAFDDAIRDGVHIISLSLGYERSEGDFFSDAVSIGSLYAFIHGITVVASVGNKGSSGSGTNLAPWIISVAASSTDRDFTTDIILGNGAQFSGESLSLLEMNSSAIMISASEANAGYFTPYQSSYCLENSLNTTKVKDKVVVCHHAENSTESKLAKSMVVKNAGGVGMIIIDEADMDAAIPFVIPAASVGITTGYKILSYINTTSNPTAKILSAKTVLGSQAALRVAPFSSKGPSSVNPDILKPDILAPGLNILAAWSPAIANMNTNIISGTSVACSHITGIVALIKSVHTSWSSSAIKSAIMTTATTSDKQRKPIRAGPDGREATPFDLGSGFVNPRQALDPGLIYDATPADYKTYLCYLGYSDNSPCDQDFSIPFSLNYPSISVPYLKNPYSISRTVTNVGKPRSIYRAAVFPPTGINVTVIPQKLVFSSYGQKINFTVKFEVTAPVKGYVFGSLSWRSKRLSVTSPMVVWTANF